MAITTLPRKNPQSHNGINLSGTFANRPKIKGHDGALYYATDLGRLLVFDSQVRAWLPADGGALYVASEKYFVDLFHGPALDSNWDSDVGTDTDPGDAPVIDTADGEGSILGSTGNAGTGAAADGSTLSTPVAWEMEEASGDSGATIWSVDFQVSAITTVEFFIGFSDVLPSSTMEMPFSFSDGTTIASTADNACGILFDTTADTDTMRLVGTAATTDATAVDTSTAPTAATYQTYTVIVDTDGTMTAFLGSTYLGQVASAIAVGTDANAGIWVNATTTTARTWRCRRAVCHQDF